jgi:hypothetical protein
MTLPTLVTPEFAIKLPSTGEEILFRPFLVKEEKILFIALEANDETDSLRAVKNVLNSCILSSIDIDTLTSFDVEYLFLNIRGKSIGEEIVLYMRHNNNEECDNKTKVTINIDEINVEGEIRRKPIVMLNDNIGIKMKYSTIKDMLSRKTTNDVENEFDILLNNVISCIEYVFDDDAVFDTFTEDELKEFVDNLSAAQFELLAEFYNNMPQLEKQINFKCEKCGVEENVVIKGLNSFFI